jgi:putative sigma-54 modulation protein
MNIEVRGKNIEVTDALKEYASKRLSKLDKYIDEVKVAQVALSVHGEEHKVEVTIPLSGLIIRGEEKQDDMYAAIDLVVEKLVKQLEKYKTKLYKKYRASGLKQLSLQEDNKTPEKAEAFTIVRSKKFALKPMDEEEAIMQMNMLGHNFFVFYNANTENINVVYKRKHKGYGLIEPEF